MYRYFTTRNFLDDAIAYNTVIILLNLVAMQHWRPQLDSCERWFVHYDA